MTSPHYRRSTGADQARLPFAGARETATLPRMLRSTLKLCLLLICTAGGAGCIKRTAPPPGTVATTATTGTTTAAPAAPDYNAPNPVQEAAHARIGSLARTDLLGGAGIAAFKISGDNAKAASAAPLPVTRAPL